MIRVNYDEKEYAYIPQKSCWVNPSNQVVISSKKLEVLKQLAVDAGHTDIDFAKPPSDMDRYVKMLDKDKKKSKPKEKKQRNPRLKSSSAVSLTNLLKKKE